MNDFSILSCICWEEWIALYKILFIHQRELKQKIDILELSTEIQSNQELLIIGIEYLDQLVKRSKNRNTISMIYTKAFLDHYYQLIVKKDEQEMQYKALGLDIIRFISQLSDINQDQKQNKSISQMLGQLNMKESEFIAEIRHCLTHKNFPAHTLLKHSLLYLLDYLMQNYWNVQYKKLIYTNLIDDAKVQQFVKIIVQYRQQKQPQQKEDCQEDQLQQDLYIGNLGNLQIQINLKQQQQDLTLQQLCHQNLFNFRRSISKFIIQLQSSQHIESLVNIDEYKLLARKKIFFALFISEILRCILKIFFYDNIRADISKQDKQDIQELSIKNFVYLLEQLANDQKINIQLQILLANSFITYKMKRIFYLLQFNPKLQPFIQIFSEIYKNNDKLLNLTSQNYFCENITEPIQSNSNIDLNISSLSMQNEYSKNKFQLCKESQFRCIGKILLSQLGQNKMQDNMENN